MREHGVVRLVVEAVAKEPAHQATELKAIIYRFQSHHVTHGPLLILVRFP